MKKQLCPCCLFPTLERLAAYEVCYLCFWEDDGQGEDELEEVWGGPNGDYSLKRARENFQHHYLMYDENDETVTQTAEEIDLKKQIIGLFKQNDLFKKVQIEEKIKEIKRIRNY